MHPLVPRSDIDDLVQESYARLLRAHKRGPVDHPRGLLFNAAERRVLLSRGEVHFAVTKNPARPFVVRAGNVDVRAAGTAFNVNLQSATAGVLVTEGKVSVSEVERVVPNALQRLAVKPLHLVANERAVVSLAPSPTSSASPAHTVVVTTASADEIALALAWQTPLLRLGGQTLAERPRRRHRLQR